MVFRAMQVGDGYGNTSSSNMFRRLIASTDLHLRRLPHGSRLLFLLLSATGLS